MAAKVSTHCYVLFIPIYFDTLGMKVLTLLLKRVKKKIASAKTIRIYAYRQNVHEHCLTENKLILIILNNPKNNVFCEKKIIF